MSSASIVVSSKKHHFLTFLALLVAILSRVTHSFVLLPVGRHHTLSLLLPKAKATRQTTFPINMTSNNDNAAPPTLEIVGLPSPLERDGRKIPRVSGKEFAILVVLIIPLWVATVAPLVVISQLFRMIKAFFVAPPHKSIPIDSGMTVAKDQIKPRADRTYDIVVLGFTGFTGRLAARHLAKTHGVNKKVKWAVAGRSKEKIEAVKQELADELNMPEIVKNIDVIVCDTTDPSTMPKLVQDTRCVVTTAGPFQVYGTRVVEACAKYGTHYCDITGEVGWVKCMALAFQSAAQETGAKIVSFCGHDSIPWDLTVYKLNQLLKKNFQDDLKTVKVWNEIIAAPSGGTYETAMLGLEGKAMKAPKCKVDPFLQLPNGEKSTHTTKDVLPIFLDPFVDGRWTSPFVMAIVNAKVVRWTHALLQQGSPKISYREVMLHADFYTAFVYYVGPLLMGSLLLSPLTKWLAYQLKLLPRPGQGPDMESMLKTNYLLVTAEGIGENGNRAESTFYFKRDPGYMETASMLVESGLCLALEEGSDKLISKDKGGFYSPAAALGDVLLERLVKYLGAEFNSRVVAKGEDEKKLQEIRDAKKLKLKAT